MPDPYNPQDLNRFSYVRNNPVRYNDPTGHMCSDPEDPSPSCDGSGTPPPVITPPPPPAPVVIINPDPLDDGQEQNDPTPTPIPTPDVILPSIVVPPVVTPPIFVPPVIQPPSSNGLGSADQAMIVGGIILLGGGLLFVGLGAAMVYFAATEIIAIGAGTAGVVAGLETWHLLAGGALGLAGIDFGVNVIQLGADTIDDGLMP